MSEIILRKYHGVGNDYLIFDPKKNDVVLNERLIRQLCRRNIGVGADGILYGPVMEEKKIKVRIFNPDGSEAERSGNGIRIFSKYLKDAGYVKEMFYELWTKAGPVQVEFLDEDASRMKVDMGYAAFGADSIHAVGFEGDMINDCLLIDRNKDGIYGGQGDLIIDWVDTDDDGKADMQIVIEYPKKNTGEVWPNGHYMIMRDLDKDNIFNYINLNSAAF